MSKLVSKLRKLFLKNQWFYLIIYLGLLAIVVYGIREADLSRSSRIFRNRLDITHAPLESDEFPVVSAGVEFKPATFSENSMTTIHLNLIYLDLPSEMKADYLCLIDPLFEYELVRDNYLLPQGTISPTIGSEKICAKLIEKATAYTSETNSYFIAFEDKEYQAQLFSSQFDGRYPFDWYSVNIGFSASYTLYYQDQDIYSSNPIKLPVFLAYYGGLVQDPYRFTGWDVNVSRNKAFDVNSEQETYNEHELLNFDLHRPFEIQIVIIVTFLVIFGFIIILLFAKDFGTFVSGSVSVFFGLFSIKNLLLPPDLKILTVIDQIISYMYIAFALAFVIYLIRKIGYKKDLV